MVGTTQMPNWWAYLFAGWTLVGMGGLLFQNLLTPMKVWEASFPSGYDLPTDQLLLAGGSSPRISYLIRNSVGSYIYILGTEVAIPLIARNIPSPYQKRIMAAMIIPALASDLFLIGLTIYSIPSSVLTNPSKWTDTIQGILVFVPIGSLIKLLWVFGIGDKFKGSTKDKIA